MNKEVLNLSWGIAWKKDVLLFSIVSLILLLGQVFAPFWMIESFLLCLILAFVILTNDLLSLLAFVIIIIAVRLFITMGKVGVLDVPAGLIMTGIFFSLLFYRKLTEDQPLIPHPNLFLVIAFVCWTLMIGLINVFLSDTNVETWYRELLIVCPLIIIPILFNRVAQQNKKALFILFMVILGLWFIESTATVLFFRRNMQAAFFLYETGRIGMDIIGPSVMIFLFLSLAIVESQRKKRIYFIGGILFSMLSLILTFNRTGEAITLVLIPVFFLLTPKKERKNRNQVFFLLVGIILSIIIVVIYSVPTLQLLLKWAFTKFLTTSNVTADVSMVNRYIEWRHVLKQFFLTPITGVGFGGYFNNYDWLKGINTHAIYTHNSFLGVLLKGGTVGFILLFTAYFRFLLIAWKLYVSEKITDLERAFVKAGIFTNLLNIVHMFTINIFASREFLLYLGLSWGYFIYLDRKIKPSRNQKHLSNI
jgi:O-antigen ligase